MALNRTTATPSGFGTFALGLFCLAFFAALIVGWVKWTNAKSSPVDLERANSRIKKRGELDAAWAVKLNEAVWVDKDKGVVQLPIADAIRGVVGDFAQKKVSKSPVKVPAAVAQPPQDPKSSEPATPALPSAPQGADTMQFTSLVPTAVADGAPTTPGTPSAVTGPAQSAPGQPEIAPAPAGGGVAPNPPPPPSPPPSDALTPPAASPAPVPAENLNPLVQAPVVSTTQSRPPLINWTESK